MSEREYVSVNKNLDLKKARAIVAGIDVGAVSTKVVIMVDRQPYAISHIATQIPKASALKAINTALAETNLTMENIHYVVGTGCGRTQVPFANERLSEISCGTAGAVHIWGTTVGTVLDAGGHSCKVAHCTESGRVTAFLLSDKCAGGIGRSMEVFADMANKELTEMGSLAIEPDQLPEIADFCSVYAQSEALDLVRSKVPLDQIIVAYHHAMASRISRLVTRLGIKKDLVIMGGLANNPGIVYWVNKVLNVNSLPSKPEWDPSLTVALGAALFANTLYKSAKV